MNFIGGIILVAGAIAALLFVRPSQDGEPRVGFMRSWIVGQLVAMAIMIGGLAGVGAIIINWPF
jgi:hypothetical protein